MLFLTQGGENPTRVLTGPQCLDRTSCLTGFGQSVCAGRATRKPVSAYVPLNVTDGYPLSPDLSSLFFAVCIPKTRPRYQYSLPRLYILPIRNRAHGASCYSGKSSRPGEATAGFRTRFSCPGSTSGDRDLGFSRVKSASNGSSLVTVMESSHFRDLDHLPELGRLNRSRFRRIFTPRQMRARMQVVIEIRFESSAQR